MGKTLANASLGAEGPMRWLRAGLVVSSPNQNAFLVSGSLKSCPYRVQTPELVPASGSTRTNDSRLFIFNLYVPFLLTVPGNSTSMTKVRALQ